MTNDSDIEHRVERWLKAEAVPMPAHILDAVRAEVPGVRQLGRRRFGAVPNRWQGWFGRAALTAAAAILVVIVGAGVLDQLRSTAPGPNGVGPSGGTPGASPSPSPDPIPGPTSDDPFTGLWSTLDIDGSPMTIAFEGSGPTRTAVVEDFRSTVCAGNRDVSNGAGTIEGHSIRVIGRGGCVGQPSNQTLDVTWTYDPVTGALRSPAYWTDDSGTLLWTRGPVKADAFSGRWTAIDADKGSLTLTLEGSGLARDVTLRHDPAAVCGAGGAFSASGTGTIGSVTGDGPYISVSLDGSCAEGASPASLVEKYRYDYATDTLVGPLAPLEIGGTQLPRTVVWHRGS